MSFSPEDRERLSDLRPHLPAHLQGISDRELWEIIDSRYDLRRERHPPRRPKNHPYSKCVDACKYALRLIDFGIDEIREGGEKSGFDWQRELLEAIPQAAVLAEENGIDSSLLLAFRPSRTITRKELIPLDVVLRRTILAASRAASCEFTARFKKEKRGRVKVGQGEQTLALTEIELKVLKRIVESPILLKGPDAYADMAEWAGKQAIKRLEGLGLLHRPQGARSGYAATGKGASHIHTMRAP